MFGGNPFMWMVFLVMLLFVLTFAAIVAKYFGLWIKSVLSGAPVSLPLLLMMTLRKVPPNQIVRWRIMAVQGGVDIRVEQLEQAYLMGVDVERAVLAMIRAKETGRDVDWEDLINADVDHRPDA